MDITRTRTALLTGAAAVAVAVTGLPGVADARPCYSADSCDAPPPAKVRHVGYAQVGVGSTLGVRYAPRDGKQYRQIRNGSKVLIVCQVRGQRMTGHFGTSNLWNKLKNGGYVPDVWVYTGKDGRVAPNC